MRKIAMVLDIIGVAWTAAQVGVWLLQFGGFYFNRFSAPYSFFFLASGIAGAACATRKPVLGGSLLLAAAGIMLVWGTPAGLLFFVWSIYYYPENLLLGLRSGFGPWGAWNAPGGGTPTLLILAAGIIAALAGKRAREARGPRAQAMGPDTRL